MLIDAAQFKDGSRAITYRFILCFAKPEEDKISQILYDPWKWTNSTYEFEVNHKLTELRLIEIDASHRMADVNRNNNRLELKW
jgi:hypothetical protein